MSSSSFSRARSSDQRLLLQLPDSSPCSPSLPAFLIDTQIPGNFRYRTAGAYHQLHGLILISGCTSCEACPTSGSLLVDHRATLGWCLRNRWGSRGCPGQVRSIAFAVAPGSPGPPPLRRGRSPRDGPGTAPCGAAESRSRRRTASPSSCTGFRRTAAAGTGWRPRLPGAAPGSWRPACAAIVPGPGRPPGPRTGTPSWRRTCSPWLMRPGRNGSTWPGTTGAPPWPGAWPAAIRGG